MGMPTSAGGCKSDAGDLMLKDQVTGRVLDVGCGRGDTVALLRDLGIPSVG